MATTKKKSKTPAPDVKATEKNASIKKTVKKAAIKKAAVKKAAVKKPSAKKTASANDKIKVTQEQRHKMICEAAYYISLGKNYQTVNPTADWLQAEEFIDQICTLLKK